MKKVIKSKPICGRPVHSYFTGRDKYLRLQKHLVEELTPPISENESLFIFVTSGSGIILINGVEFSFEKGTFAWLQSYHTFAIRAFADHPLEMNVCVYDYPLSSFLVIEEPGSDTVVSIIDAPPVLYPAGEYLSKIHYLFYEFEKEDANLDPGSSLIKVSILGQLSDLFIKYAMSQQLTETESDKPLGWKSVLYMSDNFSKDMTAASVSEYFDSNVATLNRELRNISGYNFSQMLSRIRVNISSIALLYEGMPLSYIASHTGFLSEAAFYRTFKKQMGVTPLEYREQILNKGEGVYRGMIMESTLMKILNYTYSSFSSPINISSTSKKLFISESEIRELVQKKFNINFKDLIYLNRIRHAEALLLITDLPILDIAVNVGFNSTRSLTRTFRKMHGITPGEYRSLHKGGKQ